jgi:UDP-N-acetyl-2-amino-2-deoxyglucuronate dehydrogenase
MRAALIGAAGYIAPRHARALAEHGGELVCACDTHDSVGYLDAIAPDCQFHQHPERFFSEGLARSGATHVIVCSPNYLHVTHAEQALEAGCDVILEKPCATSGTGLRSVEVLKRIAREYPERAIYPIVQLRYDPGIAALRDEVRASRTFYHVEIDYQAFRGDWYRKSWKGRKASSGGLLVNLGVHLFDLCCYIFGPFMHPRETLIETDDAGCEEEATGTFRCARATVAWRLSIRGPDSRRVFRVAGRELDLSNQIAKLHSEAYDRIFAGERFSVDDVSESLHAIDRIYASAMTNEAAPGSHLRSLADKIAGRPSSG